LKCLSLAKTVYSYKAKVVFLKKEKKKTRMPRTSQIER